MAKITINEISENYAFSVGDASFAAVALPITASWGPAYLDPASVYGSQSDANIDSMLEQTQWQRFPATQAGMESFVSTYRGPASNFRVANDYSYQQAMTLLSAGYDVLVCRVCPGGKAAGQLVDSTNTATISIQAKYAGTFGNNLEVAISKVSGIEGSSYWSIVIYVIESNGGLTAVENLICVFDPTNPNYTKSTVPYIDEVDSQFVTFTATGMLDTYTFTTSTVILAGGTDVYTGYATDSGWSYDGAGGTGGNIHAVTTGSGSEAVTKYYMLTLAQPSDWATAYTSYYTLTAQSTTPVTYVAAAVTGETAPTWAADTYYKEYATKSAVDVVIAKTAGLALAKIRYSIDGSNTTPEGFLTGVPNRDSGSTSTYTNVWADTAITDTTKLQTLVHKEWCYNAAFLVYQLLKDKMNYNPQRIISPGWDDMNISEISATSEMFDTTTRLLNELAPLHIVLMDIAFWGRCATALIDLPRSCPRNLVYSEDDPLGYAQMLSRIVSKGWAITSIANGIQLYSTHSALFGPWTQYTYVGMSKMCIASPGFIALLIQRAQILNQPTQYEWALPTNRKHNLSIGKMDYAVPEKVRQVWQTLEGVGVNILTYIPDYNINIWGNSTLFEVPPATYQALANLSTRYLVNAVENLIYRVGIGITWQYNNEQAYSAFYAGVSPLLDAAKQVGAIEDYKMKLAADIDANGRVNANTVIGKIWLVVNGVINDIVCDLVALPQGTSLANFGE